MLDDLGAVADIRGRIDRNPFGMVAVAAGAGFVLGGGLFRPLVARLIRTGVQLAPVPLLKDQLMERFVEPVLGAARDSRGSAAGRYGGEAGPESAGGPSVEEGGPICGA